MTMKLSLYVALLMVSVAYAKNDKVETTSPPGSTSPPSGVISCDTNVNACLTVTTVGSCADGYYTYCITSKTGIDANACKNHPDNTDTYSHMNIYADGLALSGGSETCKASEGNNGCTSTPMAATEGVKYANYNGDETCVTVRVDSGGKVPTVVFAVKDKSGCGGSAGGWTCEDTCDCTGNSNQNACVLTMPQQSCPTSAPTSAAPISSSPTSAAPVTSSPTSAAPVTSSPTTAPVTSSPITASPTPPPSGVGGDPHMKLFNGEYYDFHGECDMVLVHAPDFAHGLGLDIHIRTKIFLEYSYVESAAIRVGDDILEVSSWGNYALNGVTDAKLTRAHLGPFKIIYDHVSRKKSVFTIHTGDEEYIEISSFKEWVGVKLAGSSDENFGTSQGLMGEYRTGRMFGRDGTTEFTVEEAVAFGNEWQVTADEPKLFLVEDRVPQLANGQKCIMPSVPFSNQRRLGESIAEDAAEKACAQFADRMDLFQNCMYDVLASGDLEMAMAGAF